MTEDEAVESLREWVRHELVRRRITMRVMAERAGVHHTTIWRLVNGERDPSLRLAAKLGWPGLRKMP
jgi:transcriptional regulator with XRE-family HTH domain